MARNATQDEEIGQHINHIDGLELTGCPDRQAFMGELVDHVEHAIFPSIVGAVLDKVVGPDSRMQDPATLGLFVADLQPLTPPDPLDPRVVDDPACLLQQPGNLAMAVAAVLPGKLDDVGGELRLHGPAVSCAASSGAARARRTGAALGDMQMRSYLLDTGAATRGA